LYILSLIELVTDKTMDDDDGDEDRRETSASYELIVGPDASEKVSLSVSLLSVSISIRKVKGGSTVQLLGRATTFIT
jgi:hypothetical protein